VLDVRRVNPTTTTIGGGGSEMPLSRSRAPTPDFVFSGLTPGTEYWLEVSSANAKGRSKAVRLMAKTTTKRKRLSDQDDNGRRRDHINYSFSAGKKNYCIVQSEEE
jgi:hypothetical protein